VNLRVFLTGSPGIGKSTVVKKVAERIQRSGVKVGGMTTGDLRAATGRVGFEIRNLATGETAVLAHVTQHTGPKIGKYRVKSEDLDGIGVEAIASAINDADLIAVDEVGPMELTSLRFRDAVQTALTSGKFLLGSVHRSAQDPLVRAIKSSPSVELIEVTLENRDSLPDALEQRFVIGLLHPLERSPQNAVLATARDPSYQ
jgi:nucleoside-triphosphatase